MLGGTAANVSLWKYAQDIVWTTPVDAAVSADGAWKAVVDETVYEGVIVTVIIARVHLFSAHDPLKTAEIISVDVDGHEGRPRIAWTAPNVLQVTVQELSYFTIKLCNYGDIRVDLRMEPPAHPEFRDEWLRTYHLSPERPSCNPRS